MKRPGDHEFGGRPAPLEIKRIVTMALREDLGHGDITTAVTVPPDHRSEAVIVAKEPGVCCGIEVAETAFGLLDPSASFQRGCQDGLEFTPGQELLRIRAFTRAILKAERVALNFMQRMCGIATLARRFKEAVKGSNCRVVDTRKTTPGLRFLEKYAVTCGGCVNHRWGLYDGILIKDNHIAACGGVKTAVEAARAGAPHTLRIEVEVTDMAQLQEAISAGADAVLLDNMELEEIEKAVSHVRRHAPGIIVEASGGMTPEKAKAVSKTGVDIISAGMLTHSFRSIDLSLKLL